MPGIGIDLGTTFSLVAGSGPDGVPVLFPDCRQPGQLRTPSVVHIGDAVATVGEPAEQLLLDQPAARVARFFKRSLGTRDPALRDDRGREWSAEALSALVLRKLSRDVEVAVSAMPERVVVTVPAQFGDTQRRATKVASVAAGLRDPALLEEPVAAAIYYAASEPPGERTMFVYDLGGGTFDATLIHSSPDGVYSLATDGAAQLGGKDFDDAIMRMVAAQFIREHHFDPLTTPAAEQELRRFAVRAKLQLQGEPVVRRGLMVAGRAVQAVVTRAQFEAEIRPLLERSMEISERCIEAAGLGWEAVDCVLFAGGSSLLHGARQLFFERTRVDEARSRLRQPHQAVAFGAAIHARNLDIGRDGLLQRITSADLGFRLRDLTAPDGVRLHTLIPRNSTLPARATATYYTARPDQTRMVFDIAQQKGPMEPIDSLGRFYFGPLPTGTSGYAVEVSVACDSEGLVMVTARDPARGTGLEVVIDTESAGGVSELGTLRAQLQGLTLA